VVFAGLIFAREFTQIDLIFQSALAFAVFCLASSSIYLINDVIDYEKDRLHPKKSQRPIAAGKISRGQAVFVAVVFMILALAGSVILLNMKFLIVILAYIVLNIFYSFILKQIVIIDVMSIAAGFVLRAVGGAVAISVEISAWLVVCTTLLALFIGFGKRRHEMMLLEANASGHRKILEKYSIPLLEQLISIVTAATIVGYAFYTLSPDVKEKLGVDHLELTIPFVIYGIFRYLYLIHKQDQGGSPTRMLYTDSPILITVLLWIVSVMLLMYIS
jgi:4-hydroxybenzoate polyprenyltransferase